MSNRDSKVIVLLVKDLENSSLPLFRYEPQLLDNGASNTALRDTGLVALLSKATMEKYGIKEGDVLVVEGDRRGVVIAGEDASQPQFEIEDYIRLSPLARRNAGVEVGEYVFVEKVTEVKEAAAVKLSPIQFFAPIDQSVLRDIKEALRGVPLLEEMEVKVVIEGIAIPFKAVYTKPAGPVIVTNSTEVMVSEPPVSELPRVTFEDVGGLTHVIARIRELVELPVKYKRFFRRIGIEPPRGILLYGPPGCGKTLLVKALANELNAHFISINGPEIVSKWVGESEQRLRRIFAIARKKAKKTPAIIFIDEIDAIAPKRDEMVSEVERRIVAQLLALMDGLESRGNIIVIGATNRPDALDPALRRPGRFDIEIEIPIPDKKGRLEILSIHTRWLKRSGALGRDVDLEKLAEITHGYTGADLALLVKEAALNAVRRILPTVSKEARERFEELARALNGEAGLNQLDATSWRSLIEEKLLIEKLEVTFADFLAAFRNIVPSGLREIHIDVPNVRWSDIGGLGEVKKLLREYIELPLKHPDIYEKYGLKPPKGVLLYGPPGCGKTLIAKAVATESGANFIAVRGPEIFSKWVGESEKAIREIFKKARLHAPAIVFFDEIDAIAPMRGYEYDSGVTSKVVSQLITEMEGIKELNGVVVLATTNRPDILDPALLRPGRFDSLVYVPPPDYEARVDILRILTRKVPLAEDVDLREIAKKTEMYSGADLEHLVREAVMNALRESLYTNIKKVEMRHFNKAMENTKPSLTEDMIKFYTEWGKRGLQSLLGQGARPSVYT